MSGIWATLGLAPTNDEREIRRAYARKLKTVHPEDDPEGFQTLRQAHDQAMQMAKNGWAVPRPAPPTLTPMDDIVGGDRREVDSDYGLDDDDDAHGHAGWDDGPDRDWSRRYDDGASGWRDDQADRDWKPQAIETRTGWDDDRTRAWDAKDRDAQDQAPDAGWSDGPAPHDRWRDGERPDPALRAELEKERDQARRHGVLCDALQDYLKTEAVEPATALEKLLAILRSPAMDSLQTHDRTEHWLANLLAWGDSGSETLIEPIIHFFGWQENRIGVDLSHAQGVLRRRDALRAIQAVQKPGDPAHPAFQALTRKPGLFTRIHQRLTPGLSAKVQALLDRLQWEIPQLEASLNPDALAHWRQHLSRSRLAAPFLIALIGLPPLLGLSFALGGQWGPFDGRVAAAIGVLSATVLFSLGLGYLHGVAAPTRRWIDGDPWGQPLWVRFGWAPAALGLAMLGWILPPGPVGVIGIVVVSLALLAWARVVTAHLHRPEPVNVWLHAGLVPGFMVMTLLVDTLPQAPQGLAAWVGAALVSIQGARALNEEWSYLAPTRRRIGALVLIAAALGTGALLLIAPGWTVLGVGALAPVMGLTGALFLADRAMAWERQHPLLVVRRVALMIGWVPVSVLAAFLPVADDRFRLAVGLGLWLAAVALLTGLSALVEGFPRPGRKARR